MVPGWFLDGSWVVPQTHLNHACTKTTLPVVRRHGSWRVPGWFLDGSANTLEPRMYKQNTAFCAAAWFLDGSWVVPQTHLNGSNLIDGRTQHSFFSPHRGRALGSLGRRMRRSRSLTSSCPRGESSPRRAPEARRGAADRPCSGSSEHTYTLPP